ncbi:hypothetical protein WG947_07335 [Pontibacter sp. H259]|uniref:hypothetical protein n=1 Tax=Pontibacter sp. H259 TaxID=3133421 RepID=UPI0030BEF3C6
MEYIDPNFSIVPTELSNKFLSLKAYLKEQDREGNVLLLYRGEQQQNIHQRLFAGATCRRDELPYDRVFYFGEKARHFSIDNFNPEERNYLRHINDCSDATFTFIFERIANVLTTPRNKSRIYQNTSIAFRDFFLNRYNLNRFLSKANSAYTPETKLKLRDYYLYFLHGAGQEGVRDETILVSTSTNSQVARRFAGYRSRNSREENNITRLRFHYFIPKPFHNFAVSPWIIGHHLCIVEALQLPTFRVHGLYPNQQEVAVKGALFPHYILGVDLIGERRFIINPNIAHISEQDFFSVSTNGIPVDQSDFNSTIFDTGYKRWGETDGEGNFQQFEIER